jgi:hypothetical protein
MGKFLNPVSPQLSEHMELLRRLAQRLRKRADEDYELAITNCSDDSFLRVIGRSQTLKIIAEELDALTHE